MPKRTIRMEMNRVEGDLEIKLEVEGRTVTDAWCVGTMYRGFEQILLGRDPNDVLVITPRICGICSTSQLYAAASALETAYQSPLAPNATRIRNLCLMAESVMSDARQTFLMFAPDFCHETYRRHDLYDQTMKLFEPPFKGSIARQTVQYSKQILGVVIAFGGQWPHSTYMTPGGVTCPLNKLKRLGALGYFENCRKALIVDAVKAGGRAGSVRRFLLEDFEIPGGEFSAHAVGVNHLLTALPAVFEGRTMPEIVIIGAEINRICPFTDKLTPPLEAAVGRAVGLIRNECMK